MSKLKLRPWGAGAVRLVKVNDKSRPAIMYKVGRDGMFCWTTTSKHTYKDGSPRLRVHLRAEGLRGPSYLWTPWPTFAYWDDLRGGPYLDEISEVDARRIAEAAGLPEFLEAYLARKATLNARGGGETTPNPVIPDYQLSR